MKPPTRYQYGNDVKQCPTGESKMMLTLLLRGMRWNRISEKKREKAIKKLSRFFLIPRVGSVHWRCRRGFCCHSVLSVKHAWEHFLFIVARLISCETFMCENRDIWHRDMEFLRWSLNSLLRRQTENGVENRITTKKTHPLFFHTAIHHCRRHSYARDCRDG